jgi:hypothetical protein
VIRFRCSLCDQMLKVSEEKAGRPVVCPRCAKRLLVPTASPSATDRGGALEGLASTMPAPQAPTLFAGMSLGLRLAVALLAALAALGLLLAVLTMAAPGRFSLAAHWGTILAPCSFALLLVLLYGQGTSCPSCRRWWARTRVETKFVNREVFDQDGACVARSTYENQYECKFCRRRWSRTETLSSRVPPQNHACGPRR